MLFIERLFMVDEEFQLKSIAVDSDSALLLLLRFIAIFPCESAKYLIEIIHYSHSRHRSSRECIWHISNSRQHVTSVFADILSFQIKAEHAWSLKTPMRLINSICFLILYLQLAEESIFVKTETDSLVCNQSLFWMNDRFVCDVTRLAGF